MTAPSEPAPPFPSRVGRYELLLPIASGGAATVYLARSQGVGGFEREVALKLVHQHLRDIPRFLAELVEEAKVAARINHPNVVPVLDVGRDAAGTFLVMEYIEGTSLSGLFKAARLAGERLAPGVVLRILVDALSGLHAAHELTDKLGRPVQLVHRDFSPQNILIGVDGIARLTDFGVAKAVSRISHTRTGTTKGKLGYMAPEQAMAGPLDRRCDVWAAGVVAWELVARRRLFKGNDMSILLDLVSRPIPRLTSIDPDLPQEIEDAVRRALAYDREQRTPTAKALKDELLSGARGKYALADTVDVASTVERLLRQTLAERRARAADVAASRDPEPTATTELPTTDSGHALTQPDRRSRSVGMGLALGATLLVGVGVGLALGRRAPAEPSAAAAAAEPIAPAPPQTSIAPAAPPPLEPPLVSVAVESNLPIQSLRVDGAPAAIEVGKTRQSLELSPGEHELAIESNDGRTQRVRTSGADPVKVRFAPRKVKRPLVNNPY